MRYDLRLQRISAWAVSEIDNIFRIRSAANAARQTK
jgi:hypothetical protein